MKFPRLRLEPEKKEALAKLIGLVIAVFDIFTLVAIVSYLIHWKADMAADALRNAAGSLGYSFGRFLVCDCFGLGSLAILVVLTALAIRLIFHKWNYSLVKTTVMTLGDAFVAALVLAYAGRLFGAETVFGGGLGGHCGALIVGWGISAMGVLVTGLVLAVLVVGVALLSSSRFVHWLGTIGTKREGDGYIEPGAVDLGVQTTADEGSVEAQSAEGGISRRAEREEQGDDRKAPAESEAEAACPSGQLRSSGGEKQTSEAFWAQMDAEAEKPAGRLALKAGGIVGGNDAHIQISRPAFSSGLPSEGIQETTISKYTIPLSVGLSARYHFTEKLAVSAGINWSYLSREFKGNYKTESGVFTHNLQYIGVPVSVSYDVIDSKTLLFYCYAGGNAEKAISSKYYIYANSSAPILTEQVPGLQYGLFGGIGVEFKLTDRLGLYADPCVKYYFPGNQPKSIRTDRPLMFSLEAGLRFNL